jgi:hypothetical protein
MALQCASAWADFVFNVFSCLAIVIAGVWAAYQFRLFRAAEQNIEIKVAAEFVKYSAELRMLVIHARPKNIGKITVWPHKGGSCCDRSGDSARTRVGKGRPKSAELVLSTKLLDDEDLLEPGVEYHEATALVVPSGAMYVVRAEMDLGDDQEVDDTTVVRID